MIGCLIFGLFMVVFGVIVIASGGMKGLKRRRRILDTPTTPIAQAPGNGIVEIKGQIAPGEQGVILAPFSGRQCVYVRVVVEEYRSSGRSGRWVTVFNQAQFRDFYVSDGSGQNARVMPQGAEFVLDRQKLASSGTFNDAPPHLEAFLASVGLKSTGLFGFNKSMRYEEEVLAPGDPVYALGPSRRDPGAPSADAYRVAPSTQLVLFAMAGRGLDGELLLTNKQEEQLVSRMLRPMIGGVALAALGALVTIVGLALGKR